MDVRNVWEDSMEGSHRYISGPTPDISLVTITNSTYH
jgi:hypothetical protein